jgi:hypothetical protein
MTVIKKMNFLIIWAYCDLLNNPIHDYIKNSILLLCSNDLCKIV